MAMSVRQRLEAAAPSTRTSSTPPSSASEATRAAGGSPTGSRRRLRRPLPLVLRGAGRVSRPSAALAVSLAELGQIELVVVDTPAASRRWRTLIATHHYLGYTPFAGAQLRYLVESPHGTAAALGFAASAWKCAARDEHIGWDARAREARLHLVVGDARFLILPHVRAPNLASWILSRAARRLRSDWPAAYGYAPLLLETFVERGRFSGASYRAANWLCVGRTQGRGKLDRRHERALPVKDVYLYPLQRDYRRLLSAPV